MRLHSDIITAADIYTATSDLPGVHATVSSHGSRSKARGLELSLEGNGYARNTGKHGADGSENGATWDEWGVVIARLFAIDPDAFFGSAKYPVYRNKAHYHHVTGHRFFSGEMPENTHKRHNWKWDKAGAQCTKCGAEQFRDTEYSYV